MKALAIGGIILMGGIFAACGGGKDGGNSARETARIDSASRQEKIDVADAAVPEIVNGVQVVRVVVEDTAYIPSRIRLKQGVPARILFDQHAGTECASQVQIPSMNISKTDLPKGKQTAIEFTPNKSGEYSFTCGMKMLEGTLLVGS